MMNPLNLMQILRSGGNSQQMIINMMRQNAGNNPLLNNAIGMMERGDTSGIRNMVENLCKENGLKLEDVMKTTRNMFGIR